MSGRGRTVSNLVSVLVLLLVTCAASASQPRANGLAPESPPASGGRAVPGTVWFQGYLADASTGDPISGEVDIVVQLLDQEEDGSSLWGPESHEDVVVSDGWFQLELGSVVAPLPPFDTPPYYLELTVAGEALAPRQKLGSVPTALRADATDQGVPGSDEQMIFNDAGVLAGSDTYYDNESGCYGIGRSNPSARLWIEDDDNRPALRIRNTTTEENFNVVFIERTEPLVYGDEMIDMRVPEGSDGDATFITCSAGSTVAFRVRVDGTTSLGGRLSVYTSDDHGIYVETDSDEMSSSAVRGRNEGTELFSTGVRGECLESAGAGYGGIFQGGYCGAQGSVFMPDSTGTVYGLMGLVQSGVGDCRGVHGEASGTGTNYGVYGRATGTGATNWAGYFAGDVRVTGTLNPARGGFEIDHPLDPENRYLRHSFVESPEMKNIYDGVALLDASGRAAVELPDWFEALNGEFRYQLTPVGAAAPELHIAREITNGLFEIAGGSPGLKVCWQVTGIRRDPVAREHAMEAEGEKPWAERGKYLHPELYGAPESLEIGRSTTRAAEHEATRPQ
jgi:hypothetical protein